MTMLKRSRLPRPDEIGVPDAVILTGAEVRAIRKSLGFSGEYLARLLGYTGRWPRHYISAVEREVEGKHLSFAEANLLLAIVEGYTPAIKRAGGSPQPHR
jgi:hypothetical protein